MNASENGQTKHTPGPWHVLFGEQTTVHDKPGFPICRMGGNVSHRAAEEADAYLIAAAPALFAAAEAQEVAELAHSNCPECNGEREWATCGPCSELYGKAIDMRRAAVAKAMGPA